MLLVQVQPVRIDLQTVAQLVEQRKINIIRLVKNLVWQRQTASSAERGALAEGRLAERKYPLHLIMRVVKWSKTVAS